MPIRLETPMLSVDAGKMHKVDTRNVENLFGMWSVFSKCAESMENGRRLENLSWRIWNRETLCCESQPHFTTTPAIDMTRSRPDRSDIPELSASVDSVTSDVAGSVTEEPPRSAPVDIVPQASLVCVPGRSRGREKHITSLGLEKMVFSIKEKQGLEPLSPRIADAVPTLFPTSTADITPRPESPSVHVPLRSSESSTSTAPLSSSDSDRSPTNMAGSDTSAEIAHCHSVVRGFSPNLISSSYRSHTHLAPSSIPTKHHIHGKAAEPKKGDMFLLGGSSDDGSSLEDRLFHQPRQSSLTAGLRRPLSTKKQTSFRDEVESRTLNQKAMADEEVFESDDEIDASESAIDDDDEDEDGSEWEDSISDGGEGPGNDKHLFQRVDSRPNLVSRRSLLTSMLHQGDRAAAFASKASRSTPALQRLEAHSPSDSSAGTSLEEDESTLTMPSRSKMTASKPIIMTTSNTHPPALSPRTTRRNMLATELTESLRKHLLWERAQKSTTAHAVLKRRHTAFDMSTLQEYPGQKPDPSKDASKNSSWNHFFDHVSGEYHQAGW